MIGKDFVSTENKAFEMLNIELSYCWIKERAPDKDIKFKKTFKLPIKTILPCPTLSELLYRPLHTSAVW